MPLLKAKNPGQTNLAGVTDALLLRILLFFFHPDFTVGPGLSPSQPPKFPAAGRGLYRQ